MSIANPHLHGSDAQVARDGTLKRRATIASFSVACGLVLLKFVAYAMTDSVSLLSSLLDSAFDGLASLATMISVAHAAEPADHDHRYGHEKIEALSALAQAVFIFGSAMFLLFEAAHRFLHPVEVQSVGVGVGVTLVSIGATAGLIAYQRHVIAQTGSVAISADHLHYKGDLLINGGVVAALLLGHYTGLPYFDPLFALGVAVVLLRGVYGIGRDSVNILLDRELEPADRARIISIAGSHAAVRAVHDLRTRSSGARVFIEFHMELDGDMTLHAAHDVTEEVEKLIYDAFPTAEVIIHQEPAGIDDHRIDDVVASQ